MKIFSDLWRPALIAVAFAAGIFAPVYLKQSQDKQQQAIVQVHQAFNVDELRRTIEAMPNGPLKSNLYIVLATEYAGESDELNAILDAYAKLQMQLLLNKDTI